MGRNHCVTGATPSDAQNPWIQSLEFLAQCYKPDGLGCTPSSAGGSWKEGHANGTGEPTLGLACSRPTSWALEKEFPQVFPPVERNQRWDLIPQHGCEEERTQTCRGPFSFEDTDMQRRGTAVNEA